MSGTKVKLELRQPLLKCSGRDDVTCYYRGRIVDSCLEYIRIQFKYKGELVTKTYWLSDTEEEPHRGFTEPEFEDIRLKET